MGDNLEQVIGVLNGAVGDYLKRTGNGLATPMEVIRDGKPVALEPEAMRAAFGESPSPRLVVLVHGLMSTEIVWRMPDGEDYGSLLARDVGVTPVYLRFNSGLHVSENGEALDALLERLPSRFPGPRGAAPPVGHRHG